VVRLRKRLTDMVRQVGGSIHLLGDRRREGQWLSDDTRTCWLKLKPKPGQGDSYGQHVAKNVGREMELPNRRHLDGRAGIYNSYREMVVPVGPGWAGSTARLSALESRARSSAQHSTVLKSRANDPPRRVYKGPMVMNWVTIGRMEPPNIYNLANFVRATPTARG